MKKVLSVVACSILAACSCSENQWEEVDDVVYEEVAPVVVEETAPTYVEEVTPTYVEREISYPVVPAPQPMYVMPQPCCQAVPVCYQTPCCQQMPAPRPKITKTRKVITTTTTIEEPCGKPVCEPVVTTYEEEIPAEVSYDEYQQPVVQQTYSTGDKVEVTVERNPYRSEIVDMRSTRGVDQGVIDKYSPEAYNVVATRATNRMLQDTSVLYDNGSSKTIYIKDTKLLSKDLPAGSHRLKGTTKEIINGAKAYDIINNQSDADFILDTAADWFVAPNNPNPALQYRLSMYDRSGRKVNEWVEIIRQVKE